MSTAEGLIRIQKTSAGRIQRLLFNMMKLGKEKITVHVLKKRLELLGTYWKEFVSIHQEIIQRPELDSDPYISEDVFSVVEESYLEQSATLEELIQGNTPLDVSTNQNSLTRASTMDQDREPALPTIALQTFSGDILEWESFRDQFRDLIHDSTRLSKARKLRYLKSSLAGEAAKMLDRTPVTDANYDGAWASLEKRYGNPRVLSATYMRRMLQCPAVVKGKPDEIKQLLDEFHQAREALKALGKTVAVWDEWFVFLLSEKLDSSTRLQWELSLTTPTEVPKFKDLEDFLETRLHAISATQTTDAAGNRARDSQGRTPTPTSRTTLPVKMGVAAPTSKSKASRQCPVCRGNHAISYCPKYKQLDGNERMDLARKLGACLGCLNLGHLTSECPSVNRCLVCEDKHHTSLHDVFSRLRDNPVRSSPSPAAPGASSSTASYSMCTGRAVLLATAQVRLESPEGRDVVVRALLDSGSETSFLSERVADLLKLKRKPVEVSLTGFQGVEVGVAHDEVRVRLRSLLNPSFQLPVDALVTRTVTAPVPSRHVQIGEWPHLQGLPLADRAFQDPSAIDLLLGADVFGVLYRDRRVGPPGSPVAIRTPLGWVLLGPVFSTTDRSPVDVPAAALLATCSDNLDAALTDVWNPSTRSSSPSPAATFSRVLHTRCCGDLQTDLQKFWEVEELPSTPVLSPEELFCERHFLETHSRDSTGRYVVRLPFRSEDNLLPQDSRATALRLLVSSERRQLRDSELKQHYTRFMNEYLELGHMEVVERETDPSSRVGLYLPHHAVWKTNDGQAKIRVVFNASFTSRSGTALNDLLLPGPKLQKDLWLILTRWRCFRYAFSADVVKMFRQILLHPDDRDWQRILWRVTPEDKVQDYRLATVTYGTSPAPFLALRTLQQLAIDEESRFPLGAEVLKRHSYVDDILAGADDPTSLAEIRRQLVGILQTGGFPLDKWASNETDLSAGSKLLQDRDAHGALGLLWDTRMDSLSVRGPELPERELGNSWTKRAVLSEIARLFDPIGWLAPVLIKAKVFIQDLWLAGVGWDEPLPGVLVEPWEVFRNGLGQLQQVSVPRWVGCSLMDTSDLELHGFCDASERAYAAAVYMVVRKPDGLTKAELLIAKTKVAPIKVLSVPRLELCGALLLARLLTSVRHGLNFPQVNLFAWSDSTVTLDWIQQHASRWPTFVAHRVAEIQQLLPEQRWRYARSADNPADLATRGISPDELLEANLWWHGPQWLEEPESEWPKRRSEEVNHISVGVVATNSECDYLQRFSSYPRLLRVTARILRLCVNARTSTEKRSGFLTSSELDAARISVCRCSQSESFAAELEDLSKGRPVRPSSTLASYKPFLDDQGLIRVGGRLNHAPITPDQRHPVVIGKKSHLAVLLIRHTHLRLLHAGVNLTTCQLFQQFWIPKGHVLIRQVVGACTTCLRFKGAAGRQLMGNLPPERVTPTRPFLCSGVDYAGPISLRTTKGRGHRAYKGYIAVFICLCTKAVHLEAVSDLTANSFIAAFHRFTARRGRCTLLRSDNATNFRGADVQLRAMFRAASHFHQEIAEQLANDGVEWVFNPPCAPHHGGLWEAAVKSAKTHLRKVVRAQTLTFEEMATLLCQVEACLNSRPLCPLSNDPADLEPLTPGHFLTGGALTAPPEPCPFPSSLTSLSTRWEVITNLRNHFWHRWRREYLIHLQQRTKWRRPSRNMEVGDLVLLRDELSPPTKWPLARIVETLPGRDGLVRVVKLRTASATLLRPITKVVPLLDQHPEPSTHSTQD